MHDKVTIYVYGPDNNLHYVSEMTDQESRGVSEVTPQNQAEPNNTVTFRSYDAFGNLIGEIHSQSESTTNARRNVSTRSYDASGRLISERASQSSSTSEEMARIGLADSFFNRDQVSNNSELNYVAHTPNGPR